jgi:hypothetical protein
LTQYGGHHIDIDEKKVELFRKGLTIQLQDRLILFQRLSYNELVSAVIDQENTIRACEASEEKKRKMTMSGSSRGGSNGAPLKYHSLYTTYRTVAPSSTVMGQLPTALSAAAVQPHSLYVTAADGG